MSEIKILVCGDVCGNFKSLFSKVGTIVKKKGSFGYLLCVGNFFGSNSDEWEEVLSGKIEIPVPTYILSGNDESHKKFYDSVNSVNNLVYLGKSGVYYAHSGLTIAYLSGIESPEERKFPKSNRKNDSEDSIYFTERDVDRVIKSLSYKSVVDILLTSQWPRYIFRHAVSIDEIESNTDICSSLIAKLAKKLRPRYHFCGLAGVHYERVPYRNIPDLDEPEVVTRFLALAPVNNTQKEKWLYAFNITPADYVTHKKLAEIDGPSSHNPYDEGNLPNPFQYRYDQSSTSSKRSFKGGDDHHSKKRKSIDSSSCWFCLSNSDVEKQLIISIGNHCYVTLAKGILVPEHCLIVPINHALSSVELSEDVSEEVEKFKQALSQYFHDKGKDVVFFERNFSSPHLQIQVVPVPKHHELEIKEALFTTAKQHNLEFNELPTFSKIQQVVPQKKPYFYIEIMTNKKAEKKYLHIINQKFPLQFGRVVLASSDVLDVPDRIDWRQCQDSKSVEKQMAEKMRKKFAPYDFSSS